MQTRLFRYLQFALPWFDGFNNKLWKVEEKHLRDPFEHETILHYETWLPYRVDGINVIIMGRVTTML